MVNFNFNSKSPAQRLGISILRAIGELINEFFSFYMVLTLHASFAVATI